MRFKEGDIVENNELQVRVCGPGQHDDTFYGYVIQIASDNSKFNIGYTSNSWCNNYFKLTKISERLRKLENI